MSLSSMAPGQSQFIGQCTLNGLCRPKVFVGAYKGIFEGFQVEVGKRNFAWRTESLDIETFTCGKR
jgi:hypothetical protein